MGWLIELAAERDVDGLAELARRMIAKWPERRRKVEQDGLRSLLSKADRHEGLAWLDQEWRRELVDRALEAPAGTMRDRLARLAPREGREEGTMILHDLAAAPRVRLASMELPPGLPTMLSTPSRWNDEWWYAPQGSGRSLAGKWLQARGLADVVVARDWRDAEDALASVRGQEHRPLYIEVDDRRWKDPRSRVGSPVFVASSYFPPGGSPFRKGELGGPLARFLAPHVAQDNGVWRLHLSTVAENTGDLAAWYCALAGESALDATAFANWLRESPLTSTRSHELDFVLSMLTTAIRYGLARLAKAADERELITLFVLHRLQEGNTGHSKMMAEQLVERLVHAAHRELVEGGAPLDAARPRAAWRELLANTDVPPPAVVKKLLDSLKRSKVTIPREAKDRALREASDPRASADSLEGAGLLVDNSEGNACLGPRWFPTAIGTLARAALARDAPRAWGQALLHTDDPAALALAFTQHIIDAPAVITRVVADCDDDEPESVAALEIVFRCVGMLVLNYEMPRPLLRALWDRQMLLAVEGWGGTLEPRIPFATSDEYLLTDGAWGAAALAISRELGDAAHGPLAWGDASVSDERLIAAVHHIDSALKTLRYESHSDVLPRLFELGSALAARVGIVPLALGSAVPATICVPHSLVTATSRGINLSVETLQQMDRGNIEPQRVREEAERQGLEWAEFCRTVWTSWLAAGGLNLGVQAFHADGRWASALWPHVPREVMRDGAVELVKIASTLRQPFPYALLSDDGWLGLCDSFPNAGTGPLDDCQPIFDHIPELHALAAVRAGLIGPRTRAIRVLWRRFPEALVAEATRRVEEDSINEAAAFVAATPPARAERFLTRLLERVREEPPAEPQRTALSEWARDVVRNRGLEWRVGYRLLQALAPASGAR
jgi:hypothetical protein